MSFLESPMSFLIYFNLYLKNEKKINFKSFNFSTCLSLNQILVHLIKTSSFMKHNLKKLYLKFLQSVGTFYLPDLDIKTSHCIVVSLLCVCSNVCSDDSCPSILPEHKIYVTRSYNQIYPYNIYVTSKY